jgi:protein-S-isoprenylcysteine O-methyltransferase Ste14
MLQCFIGLSLLDKKCRQIDHQIFIGQNHCCHCNNFAVHHTVIEQADNPNILLLASLVTISGIAIAIYSLSMLGRSFSIIPQARKLVQTGPYKFVRHPVYLGELISILGVVLARLSIVAIALYCLLTALLIYRALQEEKLLAGIFPEYDTHFLRRARLIPGVF